MGSVISLADGSGAGVASFQYDGFGNIRGASGPAQAAPAGTGGDFRFQGVWLESATGLYHMRAREYDPRVGRFLSRDPVEPDLHRPETLNLYAFAGGNPVLYRDPTGGDFTLVSINVSIDIQSILQNIQRAGVQYTK